MNLCILTGFNKQIYIGSKVQIDLKFQNLQNYR